MDIRTVLLISYLYVTIVAIGFAISYRVFTGQIRQSMKILSFAMIFMATSWLLIVLRGWIFEPISVIVGNVGMLISQIEIFQAIRTFDNQPPNRRRLYPIVVVAMVLILYFYFSYNITSLRIVIISLASSYFSVITAIQLLQRTKFSPNGIRLLTGAPFILLTLLYIIRLIDALFFNINYPSFTANSLTQFLVLTGILVTTFSMTFGYLLMCNVRFNLELNQLAIIDPLSKMINRRGVQPFLEREIALSIKTGEPLALLVIDANHFKDINDIYGHAAGDEAIVFIAQMIQNNVRSSDLAGRLGGDEFVVILPRTDEPSAREVANRIINSIADQPLIYKDFRINLSVSLGLAMLDSELPNSDDLFLQSDRALYKAKEEFKNHLLGLD
jgi:diguanylate cyclase (GGDEF)-like protein